jgi:predicted pyridoxine 5'-phosphate oxidase superfamily flavin-nucleotide-binding protein
MRKAKARLTGREGGASVREEAPDETLDATYPEVPSPLRRAAPLPGSAGEKELQALHGNTRRATAFYDKQVLAHLNERMRRFVSRQEMAFIATADSKGDCDSSFRFGPPGFFRVLNDSLMTYPEYRGNGVMASLGNILENPHIGVMFIDWERTVGLHVNGRAEILEADEMKVHPEVTEQVLADMRGAGKKRVQRWVLIYVEEAYIHCSKHIPFMKKDKKDVHWGTDSERYKGGDYFAAKASSRPWTAVKEDGGE